MENLLNNGQPKCDAVLALADDFGDNPVTFHCELSKGHVGAHKVEFEQNGSIVTISWYMDEREPEMQSTKPSFGG